MKIIDATSLGKEKWNAFVASNYPPIGGFMQTWEWGEFQQSIGRKIGRFFVKENGNVIAVFTLVHHLLPLGFSYGYVPRGPVVLIGRENNITSIFTAIKEWAHVQFPKFIFLRLEPPIASFDNSLPKGDFHIPSYYIQPRFNTAVRLDGDGDFISRFHSSTRSNLSRAEKRGVSVEQKTAMTPSEYNEFIEMMKETAVRNGAKNIYPNDDYLKSLISILPALSVMHNPSHLSMGIFYGYHGGVLVAMNLVLFFAGTATYLFGASYSKHLNSKITTYLHVSAMKEAKQRGYLYYDLGGIDEVRWPSLTDFKRQFKGEEFSYIGNVIIPLKPFLYYIYHILRSLRI